MLECNLSSIYRKDFLWRFKKILYPIKYYSALLSFDKYHLENLIHFKIFCIFITKINEIFVLQKQNEPASLNQAVIYVNMLIYIVPF